MPTLEDLLRMASLTVFTAGNLLRRLSTNPWINSVDLTVTFPDGATEFPVRHGLGRTANGAIIVGSSATLPIFTVALPDSTAETHVVIQTYSPAIGDVTLKLRCY